LHAICDTQQRAEVVAAFTRIVAEGAGIARSRVGVSLQPSCIAAVHWKTYRDVDLPGNSGEHQLRNQEVFYGKREQTDAGISA
jgi:hypothetical protein